MTNLDFNRFYLAVMFRIDWLWPVGNSGNGKMGSDSDQTHLLGEKKGKESKMIQGFQPKQLD